MSRIGSSSLWSLVFTLLFSCRAFGQTQFDPNIELQHQQENIKALREKLEPSTDVRLGSEELPVFRLLPRTEVPCFPIHQVNFDGLLPQFKLLDDALAGPLGNNYPKGKCLGAQGIQILLERVQNQLVNLGYITSRVEALPQDLTNGTLILTLTAGRLGNVRWGQIPTTATPEFRHTTSLLTAIPAQRGDILSLRDIEQTLENLRQLPTAEADIQIVPGEEPGQSDLIIQYQQSWPVRITLSVDDGGSTATGKYQGNSTFFYDNPFKLNDQIYLNLQNDLGGGDSGERGTHGYIFHYSLPWGYWRLSATTSASQYHQAIAGATQTYLYRGKSGSHEIQIDRLIYRSATNKTNISLKVFARSSSNFIDDTEVEVQRRRTGGWEMEVAEKRYLGDSAFDARLTWRHGTGAFGSLTAPEEHFGEGTSRMKLMTGYLGIDAPVSIGSIKLHYNGQLKAQWSRTPLTPQDRFCIGGRYTVRGFDGAQSLCADHGALSRNELSVALKGESHTRLYGGVDIGHINQARNNQQLAGVFMGLRSSFGVIDFDFFVAQPLHHPTDIKSSNTVYGISLNTSF